MGSTGLPWPKLTNQSAFMNTCRLGIINQVRNVGISVIRTFHLSGMAAIGRWTKGAWIIEVALYNSDKIQPILYTLIMYVCTGHHLHRWTS
jgi:hypothetical protein